MKKSFIAFCFYILIHSNVFAETPDLPEGLFDEESVNIEEPKLPTGLDIDFDYDVQKEHLEISNSESLAITGFWEARLGVRLQNDSNEKNRSITETRFQLDLDKNISSVNIHVVADIIYDDLETSQYIQLESGQGWVDLREANFSFTPAEFLDVKIGRQILTWGTGDLLFINDLFPKGWQAFFTGRDVEYLKAPSDAIKFALYNEVANLDIAYTPRFDADRFIDGSRLSYFNPLTSSLAGQNTPIKVNQPEASFSDDEIAVRLYKNFDATEVALYAYDGYWKSPVGFDPSSGLNTFPALGVYGASLRMPVSKGIANIELGYYDSQDNRNGLNPYIYNSEFRFLLGYEQEVVQNLTMSAQYYLERMLDYDNYRSSHMQLGSIVRDRNRHVFTTRITKLSHQQNLIWSLFAYVSPSDEDFYLRANINYKLDDRWHLESGMNIFGGKEQHTFFAQFENNTNLYASIRFGF